MPRAPKQVDVSAEGTLRVSDVSGVAVYVPKEGRKAASGAFSRLGKVHMAVFTPKGDRVVGLLVKRPDIVGMVKREDVFVAIDALLPCDGGLMLPEPKANTDDAARKRLALDWDACVLWAGMDARTKSGKKLGYVSDARFEAKTGEVRAFYVSEGGVAESLVGVIEVPPSMVLGYENGFMVLSDKASRLTLTGGVAARAGEGYAKAKIAGKEVAERARVEGAKAAEAAGEAVDKGSKALGKHLGKTRGMFGAFVDEYKKASK